MGETAVLDQLRGHSLHVVPVPSLLVPLEVALGDPSVIREQEGWQHIVIHEDHTFVGDMRTFSLLDNVDVTLQYVGSLFVFEGNSCMWVKVQK
jgi:hypothetical protein